MRYGVIGTNWITQSFIQGAGLFDGMKLAAVYSRSSEKGKAFADKYGAKAVFTDLNEMASSDSIEAVYIASPNSIHYEQSKLFLEHGKHVLCEKPITVTPAEHRELSELADRKHLIYMEAIMLLHLPARVIVKKLLPQLGSITTARFDFSQLSSQYQGYLNGELPNIFNPEFATGCLMDLGVYCVYAALDFFGVPDGITTTAGFLNTGADGYGNSIFYYEGKQVCISYSKVGQSRLGSEIIGDKATLVIDSISKLTGVKLILSDGSVQTVIGDIPKHILMSGEAESFYRFATDYNRYETEYLNARSLSQKVCEVMETMKNQANIRFKDQ